MFLMSSIGQGLHDNFESIGLISAIKSNEVLIKINLSGVYQENHPRTDMTLLKTVVNCIYQNGGKCAITEAARGCLTENLITSGFETILNRYNVEVIDVDMEKCDEVVSYGEHHYIPKYFQEYPVRIAIPATSKRRGMLYSNNVKLFFGAVPRRMYQLDDSGVPASVPRPKLHQNLHLSVANLFLAINEYSPFQFYVNGGLSYNENIGEFTFTETFVGDDALEMDLHLFQNYFCDCEYPDYLDILKARRSSRKGK